MKRKLNMLGLAIAAVGALAAFGAAGAQAVAPEFHCTSTTENCVLTAQSNDHVFSFQGGTFKCIENGGVKGARSEATIPKTASSITVTTALGNAGKGCTFLGASLVPNMKSCDLVYNLVAGSLPPTATVDIKCNTAGDAITFTAASLPCTLTLGPQTGIGHIVFTNSGGAEPTHVKAEKTTSKIKYTATGVGCPKPGTFEDGQITGTTTIEGFNDEGVGGPPYKMGSKVGFHVF